MKKKKILFIVSAGHSGSTLLTKLLGQHDNVFPGSELVNYNDDSVRSKTSVCSCGETYINCPFWSQIFKKISVKDLQLFKRLKSKNSLSDYMKLIFTVIFRKKFSSKRLEVNINQYHTLYESIFAQVENEILVDASKNFFNALILASQKKYDYGFVFLTRDGRAVLNSYLKPEYYVNLSGQKFTHQRQDYNEKKVVNFWIKQNILGLMLKILRPSKTIILKHENVTQETMKELNKLDEVFQLEFNDTVRNFDREDHLFGGNSSRVNTKRIRKIDVNSWERSLTKEQLGYFNIKARLMNYLLGYKN